MSTKTITEITWEPSQGFDPRSSSTLSDATKIRLDPADFKIKLKLDSSFRYPTDADLYVRTRLYRPDAVRKLLMFQLEETTPDGTSVGLRINDGTHDRFWDGAAWSIAGVGDWNTEAEINEHLEAFDVTERQFAIVFNLVTTDDKVTPEVTGALMLWEGTVDWLDDILIDSLVGMFQDELTWFCDFALPPLPEDSDEIDLGDYTDEKALDVHGVEAVFDHANDPNHLVNLLNTYTPSTKILTLTADIPEGGVPFVRTSAGVHVAWDTNEDFSEVGQLPELVLMDAETISTSSYPEVGALGIVRKDNYQGVEIPSPYRATYKITMKLRTDNSREQQRLQEAVMRVLVAGPPSEAGPFLRSKATDRRFRLWLVDEFRSVNPDIGLESAGVRTHQCTFRIENVMIHLKPAVTSFGVKNANIKFANVISGDAVNAEESGAPVPHTEFETLTVSN